MTTTIRHVTLKSLGKNKDIDLSKGTVTNPFTQEEYDSLCNTGEWPGGYVETMGYVAPPMMDGMGDGSGSGSAPSPNTYNFDNQGHCTLSYNCNVVLWAVKAGSATFNIEEPIEGYPNPLFDYSSSSGITFRGSLSLFFFLANHTSVEWYASYSSNDNAVIGTSYNQYSANSVRVPGHSVFLHSHPASVSNPSTPSPSDISTWTGMFRGYLRNLLGKVSEENDDYGIVYQEFYIYVQNSDVSSLTNMLETEVIPKIKKYYSSLWNEYQNYLNSH